MQRSCDWLTRTNDLDNAGTGVHIESGLCHHDFCHTKNLNAPGTGKPGARLNESRLTLIHD